MTHIFSAIIEAAAIEVASPIMRLKYPCQTSISSKMECVVRCVDQNSCDIGPTNHILQTEIEKEQGIRHNESMRIVKEKRKRARESCEVMWDSLVYLADCCLHDGIKARLRRVQVPRDTLFADPPLKFRCVCSKAQNVLKTEGWLADVQSAWTGVFFFGL